MSHRKAAGDRHRRAAVIVLGLSGVAIAVTLVAVRWQTDASAQLPSTGDRVAALSASSREASAASTAPNSAEDADRGLQLRLTPPVRVRIDDYGIDAPVIPVGLVDGNVLQIPHDITKVGWYEYGPKPGSSQGSAVLVAHRDGVTQGRGVFFVLDALKVGTEVDVVTASGSTLRYRVVSVEGIRKATFQADIEEFFAHDGPPRLTLITCGGSYDPQQGGYQANVIVTAVPMK